MKVSASLSSVRSADLVSWPVVIGTTLELMVVQMASPYNSLESILPRVGCQLLAAIPAFALLFIVYRLIRAIVSETALCVILFCCIPVIAFFAGAVLGWIMVALKLDPSSLWWLRVFSTFMHFAAISSLLWIGVSALRLHYERLSLLRAEQEQLQVIRSEVDQSLNEFDFAAAETVRAKILSGFSQGKSGSAENLLERLSRTIEEVVRPLSRQLESRVSQWQPPMTHVPQNIRIDWKSAGIAATSPQFFSPIGLIVVLSLMGLPMNLARSGWNFGWRFLLLTFFVTLPLCYLVRWSFRRIVPVRVSRKIGIFVAMAVLAGLALGVGTLPIALATPKPLRFIFLGPIFALLVAFVWGLAVAAREQAIITELAWRRSKSDLAWIVARKKGLYWQRRQALAHAVHGKVQAGLAAAILELQATLVSGKATPELISIVEQRVNRLVAKIDLQDVGTHSMDEIISMVRATWSDAAEIHFDFSGQAQSLLKADPQLVSTLGALIPELVFNSIKHGKAAKISIELELTSERTCRLQVIDDGKQRLEGQVQGLGSRLVGECSISWSRSVSNGKTVTTVFLPYESALFTA